MQHERSEIQSSFHGITIRSNKSLSIHIIITKQLALASRLLVASSLHLAPSRRLLSRQIDMARVLLMRTNDSLQLRGTSPHSDGVRR